MSDRADWLEKFRTKRSFPAQMSMLNDLLAEVRREALEEAAVELDNLSFDDEETVSERTVNRTVAKGQRAIRNLKERPADDK